MPTNLMIDDRLLEQAVRLGHHKTKRETVNVALREYVRQQQRLKSLEAFGTFDFDPAYDYKKARRKR